MILYTKLLNLAGILVVAGVITCKLTEAFDEYDNSLREALFLVQLLKSNFSQILRSQVNGDVTDNPIEDDNTTCSIPPDDFNSTTAVDETDVSVSDGSTTAFSVPPSSPSPPPSMRSTPDKPSAPPYFLSTPWAPMVTPYPNWNPNVGYLPGPDKQDFPDENNRFPYQNLRRLNDPIDGPLAAPGKPQPSITKNFAKYST